MPTGYTAAIADGITFEQFALNCARAFGALVTMRDDPADAPIPERIEPSNYHQQKLEETHAAIERINSMTAFEIAEAAGEDYRSEMRTCRKLIQECASRQAKYDEMLVKVREWTPPTPDHVELKKFMDEQIVKSIDFDCGTSYYEEQMARAEALTPDQWKAQRIEKLQRDLAYHETEHQKEVERASNRTEWVSALRKSLKETK